MGIEVPKSKYKKSFNPDTGNYEWMPVVRKGETGKQKNVNDAGGSNEPPVPDWFRDLSTDRPSAQTLPKKLPDVGDDVYRGG